MTLEGGVSVPAEEKKNISKAVEEVDEKKSDKEIKEIADDTREAVKDVVEDVKEIFDYNEK